MIDLHSHLLPGLDDGSPSIERSVEVLERMAAVGVEAVALTPHLRASEIERFGEDAIEQRDEVLEMLRVEAPRLPRLLVGFEIMLDQPMPPAVVEDRRYALVGSRYYLVEFPLSVAARVATPVLARIVEAGAVPIVAHPERYHGCTVDTVGTWKTAGARMQVDATTLTRPTLRGRRARQLLEAGLADLIAADNHGDRRTMATGVEWLRSHGAERAAALLASANPRAVVENGEPEAVPPVPMRRGLWERLRDRMFSPTGGHA